MCLKKWVQARFRIGKLGFVGSEESFDRVFMQRKKKIKTEREREREKPIIKPHAYDKLCHAMEDRETVGGFGLMRF